MHVAGGLLVAQALEARRGPGQVAQDCPELLVVVLGEDLGNL